ncbi:hypothetical protein RCH09_003733 [Actimicrobium sp. GrIS 1.19]|nr:hypothetical protein [Actimicrobium sp. GrIS 1.19]
MGAMYAVGKLEYVCCAELVLNCPCVSTCNAMVERFNGRFAQERLNIYWFLSLDNTRRKPGSSKQPRRL